MGPRADFAAAAGFWLLAVTATSVSSKIVSRIGVEGGLNFDHAPLPDVMHAHFPPSEVIAPLVADVVAQALSLAALVAALRSPAPTRVLALVFWLHGGLLFLRMLAYSVTVLPSPVLDCRHRHRFAQCALCQDIHDWLPNYSTFYCNDLMFSGHTMTALLSAGFVVLSPAVPRALKALALLAAAVVAASLPIARMHYTADVLVSVVVTTQLLLLSRGRISAAYSPSDSGSGAARKQE